MRKTILTVLLFVITISGMAQTIQLQYAGDDKNLIKAVARANEILVSPEFYRQIDSKNQFDKSNYSGTAIANEIKGYNKVIDINVSSTDTDSNAKSTEKVIISSAVLNTSLAVLINTLLQELVHVVDWKTNAKWDYSPDNINPIDQVRTAPVVIGKIGENIINGILPKI